MQIIQSPTSLSLLGNMLNVIVSSTTDVSLTVSCEGTGVVQHIYSPDANNRIEVDLKDAVRPLLSFVLQDTSSPYRQSSIVRSFTITVRTIEDTPQTQTVSFAVLRAGVDRLAESIANFLQQNFLTWQPQVKPVTYYSPEFLTYYAPSAATIRCTAHFKDGTSQSLTLATVPAGQCWTIPVQYAIIAGKCSGKLPVYYDVWADNGSRLTYVQRYVASDMMSEEEQWILFENSLGGVDTFRAYGDSEDTAEHTHNIAEIDDNSEEYRVDTTRKHRKNTGYLGQSERRWLLDFFPSLGKYIYVNQSLRRIVVTESNATSSAKELPSAYDFTYKYADERPFLNLPRADALPELLDITVPSVGSFTVAPRLVEFPRLQLSDGALFPVQNPYSEQWTVTSAAELRSYLLSIIGEHGTGNELLDGLQLVDGYLLAYGDKIKAAWADVAGDIADDSPIYGRFLRKDIDDTAHGMITFEQAPWGTLGQIWGRNGFASGLTGRGAQIDKDGRAEVQSLYSREFISTPEFRCQEISLVNGEIWYAGGRGKIEWVETDKKIANFNSELPVRENDFVTETGVGVMCLHLEDEEWAEVRVGGICRGIYNNIIGSARFKRNGDADADNFVEDDGSWYAAGNAPTEDPDGASLPTPPSDHWYGFPVRMGFFTSYFWIRKIYIYTKGYCVLEYQLRDVTFPHPCAEMTFVQYGHWWDTAFQSSAYECSIRHYYKQVMQGVNTWLIRSENITHIWGYLGDKYIKLRAGDDEYTQLRGNGLFVQGNVYYGGILAKLDPATVEDLRTELEQYSVELSSYVDVVTVDDAGNVIGGLWTDETFTDADEEEQTMRTYRLTVAITVKKGDTILTLADAGQTDMTGKFSVGAAPDGCTARIENSTLIIEGIDNVKDGVSGTSDDNWTDAQYAAMRAVKSFMVRLVVSPEGKGAIVKDVPFTVKHDSQPFVGADMENEHSGVSWNEKTSAFVGLPVDIPLRAWHNDTDLKITGLSIKIGDVNRKYIKTLGPYQESPFQPPLLPIDTDLFPYGIYITTTDEMVNGVKRPVLHITKANSALPNQTDISVTITAKYAGVSYERTLVHTLTRVNDLSVYSLGITPGIVHKRKNQADDTQTVTAAIIGESSDDGKYTLTAAQATAKGLAVMCRLLTASNADALINAAKAFTTESQWTGAGWTKADSITTNGATTSILFALVQNGYLYALETEEVPVMVDGDDGKDIEFVFYVPEAGHDYTPDDDGFPQIDESDTYGGKTHTDDGYLPKVVGTTLRWTDDPTGTAANRVLEYYAKREKKDGAWGAFGDVHVWSHYGKDGDPSLTFDLTNENSFVQALMDGTVVGAYETTQCRLYSNGVDVTSSFTFAIDTDGTQHISASIQNGVVTVSNMAVTDNGAVVDMAVVVVKATGKANTEYAGKELLANYYVRKTYAAVVYRLALSVAAIPCNSGGTAKSGQLMFNVVRSERGSQTVLDTLTKIAQEGLTIKYNNTTLSGSNIKDYSIIGTGSQLSVELYKGSELWDAETLPKTLDGDNGVSVPGQGVYVSTVYRRSWTDLTSSDRPTGGSYNSPVPSGWSDGIPTGEGHIWSSYRIFTSDGESPQTSEWSVPQKQVDIPDVYDVEFSPSPLGSVPQNPTQNPSIWFDPTTDAGNVDDWTAMNWRAERVKVNGAWSDWVLTQIKGEQGDPGEDGIDGESYWIACNAGTDVACDHEGHPKMRTVLTFTAYKKEGTGEAQPFSCYWRILSTPVSGASATASKTFQTTDTPANGLVTIHATQADAVNNVKPLAQLPLSFPCDGEPGQSITGPAGLHGLVIRVTEWEAGKVYRNDTAVTDNTADRYLDIATVSLDADGDVFDPTDALIYQCKKTHESLSTHQDSETMELDSTLWDAFSQPGPIATPILWALRAMIDYLQVKEITIVDNNGQPVGGMGNGQYPLYFGNQDTGFSFVLEKGGKTSFGNYEEGQRIVIDPTEKTIGIYDSDGNLVTQLGGREYHMVEGADGLYTGTQQTIALSPSSDAADGWVSISLPSGARAYERQGLNGTMGISSLVPKTGSYHFYTENPAKVVISGELAAIDCDIAIKIWTYSNEECTADGAALTFPTTIVSGTTAVMTKTNAIKVPAGYHKVELFVSNANNGTVRFHSMSLYYMEDRYMARLFANGLAVGSSIHNHFVVYNANEKVGSTEVNRRINMMLRNGAGGLALTKDGLRQYIYNSRARMPLTLMSGIVMTADGSFSGWSWQGLNNGNFATYAWNSNTCTISFANPISHGADGDILPYAPSAGSYRYMVTVTPYNTTTDAQVQRVMLTDSNLTVKLSGKSPFLVKVEYFGEL